MRTIKNVHISEIRIGSVVISNDGRERTVCASDIKRDPFMGKTVFGDNYACGNRLVKTAIYSRALPIVA